MDIINEAELAAYLQTEVNLEKAMLIVQLTNGLVTDTTGELDPVPARVKAVALEVAARAYQNTRGLQSRTEAVDDYSVTERYSESAAFGGVYLTPDEVARLVDRDPVSGGAFTIKPQAQRLASPWAEC